MKVSISKSKSTTIYYLSKSVRVGNKTTTKTVEKIGTYDEIKKICGNMNPHKCELKQAILVKLLYGTHHSDLFCIVFFLIDNENIFHL